MKSHKWKERANVISAYMYVNFRNIYGLFQLVCHFDIFFKIIPSNKNNIELTTFDSKMWESGRITKKQSDDAGNMHSDDYI